MPPDRESAPSSPFDGTEFDAVSMQDWESSASTALRGRALTSLDQVIDDGVTRSPLYTREAHSADGDESGVPGAAPYTRGSAAAGGVLGWEIRQSHSALGHTANEAILRDLERGVMGVTVIAAPESVDELDALLDGVYLDLAPVHLGAPSTTGQRAALLALIERRDLPGSAVSGCLGADPFGEAFRTGTPVDADELAELADETSALRGSHAAVRPVAVDGTAVSNAGASDAQELGAVLATGVAWLRALTAAGLEVDDAARSLEFTLSLGADQFLATAKIRAARTGGARIVVACGGDPAAAPMVIHATSAASMMSQRDPWVNMLRTTTACFAAAVGGADAITVRPFDSAIGASDEFALRVARNTQLILQEETQAARVIDPAGGSWYVEDLTRQLAEAGWNVLQKIESVGGMAAALADGSIRAAVAETQAATLVALSTRRTQITGVNEFPDVHEAPITRAGAADEVEFRLAAPFESLRDAADAAAARPTVFLANLGDIATHTARATFAKNLFEVGGAEAVGDGGHDTAKSLAAAFASSGARVACICSSDAVYAEWGPAAAAALVEAGAERVYLAGSPGEDEQSLREAGVADFVHLGCDVLSTLRGLHDLLGL